MRTWVLVYDISDDRIGQRVAKRVARDGVRVQASVFEVVARTDAGFLFQLYQWWMLIGRNGAGRRGH